MASRGCARHAHRVVRAARHPTRSPGISARNSAATRSSTSGSRCPAGPGRTYALEGRPERSCISRPAGPSRRWWRCTSAARSSMRSSIATGCSRGWGSGGAGLTDRPRSASSTGWRAARTFAVSSNLPSRAMSSAVMPRLSRKLRPRAGVEQRLDRGGLAETGSPHERGQVVVVDAVRDRRLSPAGSARSRCGLRRRRRSSRSS